MQTKVLVVEKASQNTSLVVKMVTKANLVPVCASSLAEAKLRFDGATPEDFLCAIVEYQLPDAPNGQAIDFAISAYIPTIAVTREVNEENRQSILIKEVVDYISIENAQVYDYLSRLLSRMEKNKRIGVVVVDPNRRSRVQMGALLRRLNLSTFEASNAQEALSCIQTESHIKIVLLDASVNDIPPTQLIAKIRKSYSKNELAIIGLAAENAVAFSARFIKSGANDFLRMPFCHDEFLCRITQSLEMIEQVELINRAANTDYLTGLPNRRHFFQLTHSTRQSAINHQALALIDLDFFKRINDTYGHDAGDVALNFVANEIKLQFSDVHTARFGGEEFCIYFYNIPPSNVLTRLNEFRKTIEKQTLRFQEHIFSVTASVGVTLNNDNNIDTMLADADALLYKAKNNGRNLVLSDLT